MKDQSASWEAIAARLGSETGPAGDAVPFGFATRVVSWWRAAQREEKLRRWSLWSLRAAVCSAALCALVMIFSSRDGEPPILLTPPSAEFLAPPLSNP
ncbi:MAG: hypothetical protein NTW21_10045 [Verrucomicrobia bacterium]|nr:hypothetical protein [Verrucomicrobiota bacterium]